MTKQEAVQAHKARRKALKGRSTSTAKALNVVGQMEALAYAPKPERPYSMEGRKAPPRGRALYIETIGHLAVKQNPRSSLWNGGAIRRAIRKSSEPLKPMTYDDFIAICTTTRNDHPARKT